MSALLGLYLLLSFAIPVGVVLEYASVHKEFFTLAVELTNSPLFHLLCVNSFIALAWVLWFVARATFFGKLNRTESDAIRNATPMCVVESLICPFYFGVPILGPAGVVSILTVVVAVLHRLAQERIGTLQIVEERATRIPMLIRLFLFLYVFFAIDLYVVFDLVGASRHNGGGKSLQYCIALLYSQFLISILEMFTQLLFLTASKEGHYRSAPYYFEMFYSFAKSMAFFVSFFYISAAAYIPIPLMRMLMNNGFTCLKNISLILRYRRLTGILKNIPNATEEVLTHNPRCAICYDDMTATQSCKQLSCGHCYHESCLLRWFEKMSTCPYCRTDIIVQANNTQLITTNRQETSHPTTTPTNQGQVAGTAPSGGADPEEDIPEPVEGEIRRLYEWYLAHEDLLEGAAVMRDAHQLLQREIQRGQEATSHLEGQNNRDEPSTSADGIRNSPVEVPPPAGHVPKVNEKGAAYSSVLRSSIFTPGGTKEALRSLAYKEFERSVTTAVEVLQRRLRDIDADI